MNTKAIDPISLTEGMRGRLSFYFILQEGAEAPPLRGALLVNNQKVDMVEGGENELIIPTLPTGVHLAEVRAGNACVLYSHVEVLPSPLANEEGDKGYLIGIDLTADVLQVTVNLAVGTPGAPGKPGEKGDKGDKGAPGTLEPEAMDKWLRSASWASTPPGSGTAEFSWIRLAAEHVREGYLASIGIMCREDATATMTTATRYLGIWEQRETEDEWLPLGCSTEAVAQVPGQKTNWPFGLLHLSGRPLRLCLLPGPEMVWDESSRFAAKISEGVECGSCVGLAWDGSTHPWLPQLTLTLAAPSSVLADARELAAHVQGTGLHLQEGDREKLDNWTAGGGGSSESDNGEGAATALEELTQSLNTHLQNGSLHLREGEREHFEDTASHVTEAEKTTWNNKPDLEEDYIGLFTHKAQSALAVNQQINQVLRRFNAAGMAYGSTGTHTRKAGASTVIYMEEANALNLTTMLSSSLHDEVMAASPGPFDLIVISNQGHSVTVVKDGTYMSFNNLPQSFSSFLWLRVCPLPDFPGGAKQAAAIALAYI